MQNGELSPVPNHRLDENVNEEYVNGISQHDRQHADVGGDIALDDHDNTTSINGGTSADAIFRGKKRKLVDDTSPRRSRAVSPPWKRIEAEGPTSFLEDGRRKSGRTNAVPMDLQPQSDKRQTRAAVQRTKEYKRASSRPSLRDSLRDSRSRKPGGRIHFRAESRKPPSSGRSASQAADSFVSKSRRTRSSETTDRSLRRSTSYSSHAQNSTTFDTSYPSGLNGSGRRVSLSRDEAARGVNQSRDAEPPIRVRRLRLHYTPPKIPILHPLNFLPKRKYSSVEDYLAHDDPLEGEADQRISGQDARASALTIHQLEQAAASGGLFCQERWTQNEAEAMNDIRTPYTHPDYLQMHIYRLKLERDRERRKHVSNARKFALLCLEEWKRRQPKTDAELLEQQSRRNKSLYKFALRELATMWRNAENHIRQEKLRQYEAAKQDRDKKAINRVLEHSNQLLVARQKRRLQSDEDGAGYATESLDQSTEMDDELSEESSPESDTHMTTSDESEPSRPGDDSAAEDDELTPAELQQKYRAIFEPSESITNNESNQAGGGATNATHVSDDHSKAIRNAANAPALPNVHGATNTKIDPFYTIERQGDTDRHDQFDSAVNIDPSKISLDEVEDILLDSTGDENSEDESSEDDGSSSAAQSSEDEQEDDGGAESDEQGNGSPNSHGLIGFLTRGDRELTKLAAWPDAVPKVEDPEKPLARLHTLQEEQQEELTGAEDIDHDEATNLLNRPDPASTSDERSMQATPTTITTAKASEPDSASSLPPSEDESGAAQKQHVHEASAKTQIPPLLRGQLREYQHEGLDWLAGLYDCHTNGILADEMGLGKTIQTIALLAHLATERHIWGPHLIVVPTSVMLNWELEFKKWFPGFKILTYYGTIEERKSKRRGSADGDKFNVFITSYQLALQDASSLKRRNWHYMILDEAHNIKNFRSQRWQTLLSFKSEARLLLTGTPLQNNLAELWSLLFFLNPELDAQGNLTFGDLSQFSRAFHRPVDQIMDQGREIMDEEAKRAVAQLHRLLRPHLLRRLKADVEKQMPKKYEHIVRCRLSKRQRQLYDGYMGLTGTRDSFASGNYLSIINCLMQLRKVCNHPDLFETRQIVTSFAMPKSAIADFEVKELLIRRQLLQNGDNQDTQLDLMSLWRSNSSAINVYRGRSLAALEPLANASHRQNRRVDSAPFDGRTVDSALKSLDSCLRRARNAELYTQYHRTYQRIQRQPAYGSGLLDLLQVRSEIYPLEKMPARRKDLADWYLGQPESLRGLVVSQAHRSESMVEIVKRFACVTPAVVAPETLKMALTSHGMEAMTQIQHQCTDDPFHEARVRLSIAFPDKSLIQYDCGKLQQLDKLLRQLQNGGHRALIFTQMTKVLDILEQFLNLHGHRYLRLDGATKIEQRQVLTERFNSDPRILAFILSSRSGGLGVNLTGADTVIFYDLDWNPAMDKQCQDRCHRIGQTRDVHIYRFVSEGTIEANILRKSNQKRMLDDVVIQEGDFTTDYFNRIDYRDLLDGAHEGEAEAEAALDKVLGGGGNKQDERLFEAEDHEDREAAKTAQREDVQTDDVDFEDKAETPHDSATPAADAASTPVERPQNTTSQSSPAPAPAPAAVNVEMDHIEADSLDPGSIDHYMIRFMQEELHDLVVVPASERAKKKAKKGKDSGLKMRKV